MDTDPNPLEEGKYGCDQSRIMSLSDGVFAIAMTLLVLGVVVTPGLSLDELPAEMLKQLPQFVPYLTCFVVIGVVWDSHQRMMQRITHCSPALVWLNLLLLLFVTFLPANSKLIDDYPTAALAVASMAVNIALLQLTSFWMSWYAWKAGLMNEWVKPELWHKVNRNYLLLAAAFLLSIPVAFVSPQLARLLWIVALIGVYFVIQRSINQDMRRQRTLHEKADQR